MLFLLLNTLAALVIFRILVLFVKNNVFHPLPAHAYPLRKDKNFALIKKSVGKGTLPKAFRPASFPLSTWTGGVILADYDLIKDAFSRKELSNRLFSEKLSKDMHRLLKELRIGEMVERILGPEDTLAKNGLGDSMGMGDGYYDETHRNLRVHWHDTIKRLVGRNTISEIIQHSTAQVNRYLAREDNEEGIDPREIFMNGTMNVVTGFSLGILYEFDDPGTFLRSLNFSKLILDFKNVAKYVSVFFENMRNMYVNKIIVDILPLWVTQNWLYQLIVKKPLAQTVDTVSPFTEYILTKVKEHRATLDFANPKDFLGSLKIFMKM